MFKNIRILTFKCPNWLKLSQDSLKEALQSASFAPTLPTEKESIGWVAPRPLEHSPLFEKLNENYIFKLKIEKKSVPPAVIRKELDKWIAEHTQKTGSKVSGSLKKEKKAQIELALLPRAFSRQTEVLIWVDPVNERIIIGTGSASTADAAIAQLLKTFDLAGMPLQECTPLLMAIAPRETMAKFLREEDLPEELDLHRNLSLVNLKTGAAINYNNHTLDLPEIREHLADKKVVSALGLQYKSFMEFTLTADMQLKNIQLIQSEDLDAPSSATLDEKFDFNLRLSIESLTELLNDLIPGMGGTILHGK